MAEQTLSLRITGDSTDAKMALVQVEKATLKQEQAVRKAQAALKKYGAESDQYKAALIRAREATVKLDAAQDRLKANTAKTGGAMKKVREGASEMMGGIMAAGAAFTSLALFVAKATQAYQESRRAELQLQNTLANMPSLAGASQKAFTDLAKSLQNTTAAEDDATVAAMAMLGTFEMTQDEILELTPLIVDYARKFGVDLVEAAKQVGKAYMGQIGALQRNGVTIDKVAYSTDRYAAIQQALREQVGGFAREEAESGIVAIERLNNAWGDLLETVGALSAQPLTRLTVRLTNLLNIMQDGGWYKLADLIKPGGALIRGFGGLDEGLTEVSERTRETQKAVREGRASLVNLNATTGKYTMATEDASEATEEYTRSLRGEKVALDSLQGQLRTLTELRLDASDAALNLKDAEARYKEAVKESGRGSDEAKRALNDLERAKMRAADAAVELREKQEELGATERKLAREDRLERKLERLRQRAQRLADALASAGRRTAALANPGRNTGGPIPHADGGFVNRPTFAMIGEAGPEYVIPVNNRARSHALLASAARSMGYTVNRSVSTSVGSVNVNVAGTNATATQIAAAVENALGRVVRRAGQLSV